MATKRFSCTKAPACSRASSARSATAPATIWSSRPASSGEFFRTPGVDQRMLVVESSGGHIEPPRRYVNQYGQFLESAPYAERDLRPPEKLVTHDEEGEFEVRVKARGLRWALSVQASPTRCRRLGRSSVAVCVQHRGLRADHWACASTASGASDVRGAGVRPVLVRAAAVRLPSAGDSGALQPLERRFRRGHLLREGRFHVAARRRSLRR